MSHSIEKIMQLYHLSLQFLIASKDNFGIHRSGHFLFQRVKTTLTEQAVPHRGKLSLLLKSENFSYQTLLEQ